MEQKFKMQTQRLAKHAAALRNEVNHITKQDEFNEFVQQMRGLT